MFPDRIEFYNPGGLLTGINAKNIASKQFSRNPTIANALAKIEYIEELGEGWDKIIKEHKEHPLKPMLPKIDADEHTFLVNIYSTKDKFLEHERQESEKVVEKVLEKVTENQQKILEAMKDDPHITIAKLSEIVGISDRKIQENISKLKAIGLVKRVGPDKGGYWKIIIN